jgi:hypothetical protein
VKPAPKKRASKKADKSKPATPRTGEADDVLAPSE